MTRYLLKDADGQYFALAEGNTAVSVDKAKATLFDTLEEANTWLDMHALYFIKLKDLGFKVFKREV